MLVAAISPDSGGYFSSLQGLFLRQSQEAYGFRRQNSGSSPENRNVKVGKKGDVMGKKLLLYSKKTAAQKRTESKYSFTILNGGEQEKHYLVLLRSQD